MSFQYQDLTPAEVSAIEAEVSAPPPLPDYKHLLPAWEADHAGNVAALALATSDEDKKRYADNIAALEAAITRGRAQP